MNNIKIPAGGQIFSEGESGNTMYIILSGQVEIYFTIKKETTRLALMNRGDFFGEMALFRSKPRSASARAVGPTELAVVESKQQLEKYLVKNPDFAAKMVRIMVERLANTNDLLIDKINEASAREIEFGIR